MKPRFRLRLVRTAERPLRALSMAEKRAAAIAYLKQRNLYVLQQGSKRPSWGVPGTPKALGK
jgi:hypothetical protein